MMFDLENAINQWCKEVGATRSGNADLLEELKDHLSCEIDSLQKEGLTEEQAFRLAIRKMGDADELLKEYSSNRRLFSLLCSASKPNLNEYSQQRGTVMSYKKDAKRILMQAVLWAAAILLSALLLGDAEQYSNYMLLLLVLGTTSIMMDPGYKETARVECAYIRRLFRRGGKA